MTDNPEGTLQENNPAPIQAAVEGPVELDLDSLIEQTFSAPEFSTEVPHKGIDFKKVVEDLPPDARKLIHNLREDYRKKTTSLSQKTKELETREGLLLSKSTQEKLAALSQLPDDIDLYDPAGLQRYIEAKAAEQLQSLLEPAREELRKQTRQQQVETFKSDKPDFDNLKIKMAEAIKTGKVSTVEDAYHYIKGISAQEELRKRDAELEAYKRATREAGLKVASGINSAPSKPIFKSAYDAYLYEKSRRAK